jgi:two-component system chemotaxis response regulator CheB
MSAHPPPGTGDDRAPAANPPEHRPGTLRAVAIGASAGGIDALNALLPMLPADFAPAVLIVLHLRPDTPSLLSEMFSLRCALPVREAEDKMPVLPGHVYVAPPDYHLLVEADGAGIRFALSVEPPVRFSRPSIDVLFESAAVAWHDALLGVVLSGANDDGTRGLQAIRARGGRTWVQSPATAQSSEMPSHAIAGGPVDEILTIEEIGSRLRQADL